MTHELKDIVEGFLKAKASNQKCVLATVVALDGSSYRRPGVRMLIREDNYMIGAVSGGCVEKEILFQATSVFKEGIPKVITYDGRFRLGCEGLLYILIEPFNPNNAFLVAFENTITKRLPISIRCYYLKKVVEQTGLGTEIMLDDNWYAINNKIDYDTTVSLFKENMLPRLHLILIGAEHDAVVLCAMASKLGWEVTVVAHPSEAKEESSFSGISSLQHVVPEDFDSSQIDSRTVMVLMTHSYVKDLQFLMAMHMEQPKYVGLLGPNKRREKLLNEFIERCPDVSPSFLDSIYGPSGLNIGAETPQEIAVAILAEILSVIRSKEPMKLRDKNSGIHD